MVIICGLDMKCEIEKDVVVRDFSRFNLFIVIQHGIVQRNGSFSSFMLHKKTLILTDD